jgi:hypothetical protein
MLHGSGRELGFCTEERFFRNQCFPVICNRAVPPRQAAADNTIPPPESTTKEGDFTREPNLASFKIQLPVINSVDLIPIDRPV